MIIIIFSAVVLCLSGVVYSFVYMWLNVFSKIDDLEARSAGILKVIKTSMILSFVFTLMPCLLSNPEDVSYAINRSSKLYYYIGLSWFVVIYGCGISLFIALVSKTRYREGILKSIKGVFLHALAGAIIGIFLSWLLN